MLPLLVFFDVNPMDRRTQSQENLQKRCQIFFNPDGEEKWQSSSLDDVTAFCVARSDVSLYRASTIVAQERVHVCVLAFVCAVCVCFWQTNYLKNRDTQTLRPTINETASTICHVNNQNCEIYLVPSQFRKKIKQAT